MKLRQLNLNEIGARAAAGQKVAGGSYPYPALIRFIVVVGACKWVNSLIVGNSLIVHLFFD